MRKLNLLNTFFGTGVRRKVVTGFDYFLKTYTAGIAAWVLYSAIFSRLDVLATSVVFLCLILAPSFLYVGGTSRSEVKKMIKLAKKEILK